MASTSHFKTKLVNVAKIELEQLDFAKRGDILLRKRVGRYCHDVGVVIHESVDTFHYSAIFITWCMRAAGASKVEFPTARSHCEYAKRAHRLCGRERSPVGQRGLGALRPDDDRGRGLLTLHRPDRPDRSRPYHHLPQLSDRQGPLRLRSRAVWNGFDGLLSHGVVFPDCALPKPPAAFWQQRAVLLCAIGLFYFRYPWGAGSCTLLPHRPSGGSTALPW